jgi:hypothetical protein
MNSQGYPSFDTGLRHAEDHRVEDLISVDSLFRKEKELQPAVITNAHSKSGLH